MIKFDFQNLISIVKNSDNFALFNEFIPGSLDDKKFLDLKNKVLSRKQAFLELPYDLKTQKEISKFAEKVKGKYRHIVILGIGGSMLGPKCLIETLKNQTTKPQVHFVDNIDPDLVKKIETEIDFHKTLFLVQTKSGTTPETLAQYFYFRALVIKLNLSTSDHFCFVTDKGDSYLNEVSITEGIPHFFIPTAVGGRFSVLSAVGLVVSALTNININQLLKGAAEIKEKYFDKHNPEIYLLALAQYQLYRLGKNINVIMPYSSRLKTFSDWYLQLLSESIGKSHDLEGNLVNVGITGVPALGATDQHSQLQLFKEGPNDKLIIFLRLEKFENSCKIPSIAGSKKQFQYLENISFEELITAEFLGTRQSLTESEKTNITISISELNEFNLGALFMIFEIATAFLGEFLNINTYDQPGVERSKVLTREFLKKNRSK